MTIPSLTAAPDLPDRTEQDQTTFDTRMAAYWAYIKNDFEPELNLITPAIDLASSTAVTSETNAVSAAATAASTANGKGNWSALTGSLSVPASVYHDNENWQLLQNLADVTSVEPGTNGAVWKQITGIPYQTGNSGKFLSTDGTSPSWEAPLPDQASNSGKFLTTNGTAMSWESHAILASDVTTTRTVIKSDQSKIIDITSGTFTLLFSSVATLEDGFYCYVRNAGTGDVTLDTNGAETIDGLSGFVMYPGEVRLFQCDGSKIRSIVLCSFFKTFTASGTFHKPPGYAQFGFYLVGGGPSGTKGSTSAQITGGGGAAGILENIPSSSLDATESVVIAASQPGKTVADTNGTNGGDSTFSTFTAQGGTAGIKVTSDTTGGAGGMLNSISNRYITSTGATGSTSVSESSLYGGGQGGSVFNGGIGASTPGSSVYGSNGSSAISSLGGTNNTTTKTLFAGAAGASNTTTSGTDGTAPGGPGGATQTGTTSGAGARGELRIWGIL